MCRIARSDTEKIGPIDKLEQSEQLAWLGGHHSGTRGGGVEFLTDYLFLFLSGIPLEYLIYFTLCSNKMFISLS